VLEKGGDSMRKPESINLRDLENRTGEDSTHGGGSRVGRRQKPKMLSPLIGKQKRGNGNPKDPRTMPTKGRGVSAHRIGVGGRNQKIGGVWPAEAPPNTATRGKGEAFAPVDRSDSGGRAGLTDA